LWSFALTQTRASSDAIPDSFKMPFRPSPNGNKGKGFLELWFGRDEANEGKIRPAPYLRILAVIPFVIPLMGTIAFTHSAYEFLPLFKHAMFIFAPAMQLFYGNSFIPFMTFFALFLLVVRNEKIPYFVRYCTMQAILLDICCMLGGLIMQYMPIFIMVSWVGEWMELWIFVNSFFALGYSIFNALQGLIPEAPLISEAVYAQVQEARDTGYMEEE
jgi:hypothetical protein|tara:strand:+ start:14116 stop:14763 length:648 start_codon:yes stop_codon:yes gene_type:complete